MAKRRTKRAAATTTVSKPRGGGGIVVVRERVAAAGKRIQKHRRSGGDGVSLQKHMQNSFIAGAILGFVEKNWGDKIPEIPFIGRKGAIAGAIYFMKPKAGVLRDAGILAAGLSGYELTKDGHISGL